MLCGKQGLCGQVEKRPAYFFFGGAGIRLA